MGNSKKGMDRKQFLQTAMAGAGGLTLGGMQALGNSVSRSDNRPNIVLIMADDMGFSDIGPYGGEIQTPNLDRLAQGGMRFSQFYNYARCCPTRASLMTSLHPHQAGIGHMTSENDWTLRRNKQIANKSYQGYLNRNCVTLAEALGLAGYQTFMAGKWHVGTWRPNWPVDRGFDRYFGIIRGASDYFKPRLEKKLLLDDKPFDPPPDFYTTDYFSNYAAKFIRESNSEQPFFLYTAYTCPHWPLQAWEEDIARYEGQYLEGWDTLREQRYQRQLDMELFGGETELSPRHDEAEPWEQVSDKEDWAHRMAVYAAMVDRMDQGIGQIIDALEQKGQLENTLIMFLSDNGGCAEPYGPAPSEHPGAPGNDTAFGYYLPWANASNTPFRLYKHWTHEGGIGTPCIAHWPEGITNTDSITHQMGTVVDLMPTFLEVAGADYPDYYNDYKIPPLEGQSLVPVLEGDESFSHAPMHWEHEGNRAVRDGRWKLTSYYSDANQHGVGHGERTGRWELYDLKADRTELKNVIDEYPKVARQMIDSYDRWANRVGVLDWEEINRRNGNL
ncbi:arylsulfatase [Aliifodinibius sp. S!AR15-10]|uniref:arylsulfatase n=1 Tax=Aliifodinibius sp. S!AR15-10 TaxID=2950437 RepID=UPI002855EA9B|nr:arylsulfatase [Aliifodinibius sp. S!AR15-10]MDR8392411.1 arylsulfatase [Aliifodinibius sp. S!AR15-10]